MIKISKLSKSYGELSVLKNIDITINKGEITSIIGASGAGKSTLLQIIGSLDRPSHGDVEINNINITSLKGNKLAKFRNEQLGFIFQFHHLLPEFTALENVILPGLIAGRNKNELIKEAENWLSFLNLKQRGDHKPSSLSGGEQQRVAVARALINKPQLILADEPSGNLDSKNASELHTLFAKLRDEFHQTFIIVTHNETLAKESNRMIELRDGAIINDIHRK